MEVRQRHARAVGASPGGRARRRWTPPRASIHVGASPFGSYWYPVRPFGDVVFRIQYTVENTPTSTPQRRHHDPHAGLRYTGADNNAVLAQKPTGFNYDVCPGASPGGLQPACTLTTPAASTTYTWAGRPDRRRLPPARHSSTPAATARARPAAGVYNVNGPNGQPLTINGNANNHQHWTQVYCGHEIQINESLNGGGPHAVDRSDQDRLGLRLPQPQRAAVGHLQAPDKGVWHEYEIRTIGQQYTILIDGEIINQFDNSIPKIAYARGRPADDGAPAHAGLPRPADARRQRPHLLPRDPGQGVRRADIPVNTAAPSVTRLRLPGQAADLQPRHVERRRGQTYVRHAGTARTRSRATNPRFRAPSAADYGNFTDAADRPTYGTQAQTVGWTR